MNILVTGSHGFIGRHLCHALRQQGHSIDELDTRAPFPRSVVDRAVVHEAVRRADFVFHLASVVGYAHVMANIETAVHITTVGTSHVVRACLQSRTPLLFTSTSAVYGHGNVSQPAHEGDPLKLGSPTVASWAYAYAKAAAECQVLAAHREQRLPVTVVRLFNVVGPGQSGAAGFVFPRFVRAALEGRELEVYAPGTQTRTFAHVADVVEGIIRLAWCPDANGEVVNVGGTVTMPIRDLAQRVIAECGSVSAVRIKPPPYTGYEEIRERRPDLTKARRLVGYEPTRSLAVMIRDTAAAMAGEVLV